MGICHYSRVACFDKIDLISESLYLLRLSADNSHQMLVPYDYFLNLSDLFERRKKILMFKSRM